MQMSPRFQSFVLSHITPKKIFLLCDILFLLVHFIFIFSFKFLGVNEMAYFNIGSVTLYAVLAFLLCKTKNPIPLICITLTEMLTHAVCATIFVGWPFGFALYIVCAVPIPFFINFKKPYTAYFSSIVMVIVFVVLRGVTSGNSHVIYSLNNVNAETVFYIFNSICSFLLIIAISAIYRASMGFTHLRLKAQNESLSKLATVDPLTELFNRRAMTDFMKQIHEKSRKTGEGYTIVMGDIDDFKKVNDEYGHACGDAALKGVSSIVIDAVPAEGYVCRWGGEEILFVIPSSDLDKGTSVAEEIRSNIENKLFEVNGSKFRITVTFGVCECNGERSYEKAISTADQYLYCGKQHGKNCVVNKWNYNELNKKDA